MKAYTIHKHYVCKLTGAVLIERTFQQGTENEVCQLLPFSSEQNAASYIEGEKRDWFITCIEKYVNHKEQIIVGSGNNDAEILESLRLCKEAVNAFMPKGILTMAKAFMRGIAHFEKILPSMTNNSYVSSANNLEQLKSFCINEIKEANGKQ